MIVYRLSSKNGDTLPDPHDLSSPEGRELAFKRILKKTRHRPKQRCAIAHTKLTGQIKTIIRDHKEVQWKQGSPYFIVVSLDDGREVVCSRAQIWKVKRIK